LWHFLRQSLAFLQKNLINPDWLDSSARAKNFVKPAWMPASSSMVGKTRCRKYLNKFIKIVKIGDPWRWIGLPYPGGSGFSTQSVQPNPLPADWLASSAKLTV